MYQSLVLAREAILFFVPPPSSQRFDLIWTAITKKTNNEGVMLENNLLTGRALQGSTRSQVKNGSLCPRPKCIPWPENELAAHVTYDLHRKRPVTLYNDRSLPKSAWAHSMTYNPSLLSCKIEIDNKMLY